MSDDLISRQAALKRKFMAYYTNGAEIKQIEAVAVCEIEKLPAADAVPVAYSEWIPKEKANTPYGLEMECAKCGFSVIVNDALYFKFCPVCGAEMDGLKIEEGDD